MPERSVAENLLVRAGGIVGVLGDATLLGALPEGATSSPQLAGADVAIIFVESRAELLARFASELPSLASTGAVWFCYRKANAADLNRDTIIRESGAFGWRPISNIAVDETWSAVRVRELRPGEDPT
ncbi:MAG: hypothetical protein JWO10_213 [Microbacteriaceae bacterium]|nr:hypothetical protein [Microbacteriaceae bacterium]